MPLPGESCRANCVRSPRLASRCQRIYWRQRACQRSKTQSPPCSARSWLPRFPGWPRICTTEPPELGAVFVATELGHDGHAAVVVDLATVEPFTVGDVAALAYR